MDAISGVMALANVVPQVLHWLGHDNAGASAARILSAARDITGEKQDDSAITTLRNNPQQVKVLLESLGHNRDVLAQTDRDETAFRQENADAVNRTMRVESRSAHWPTYSWRPFIGFCFGASALFSAVTVAVCYLGVMFFQADSKVLGVLPGLIGAEAGIMATMSPVLGIASWFRGKMQASVDVTSDNRG